MLTEKGISVDHGCRVQHVTEASPLFEPDKPGEASDDSNEPVYPKVQQVSRERRGRDYKGRPERLQCYCCGSREHLIRYCPNKRCTICGTLGHRPSECPRKPKRSGGQRDAGATFTGERRETKTTVKNRIFLAQGDEDAVTIEVYIGPHKVEAMLDTGARPSVIDINTAPRIDWVFRLFPRYAESTASVTTPLGLTVTWRPWSKLAAGAP